MTPNLRQASAQPVLNEQQRFLDLARRVSETIGTEFFSILVDHLRGVLNAKCVYIGEFVQRRTERVRILAASAEPEQVVASESPLAGSPDAQVAVGNPCWYAREVREAFPEDCRLRDLEAEAFVGVPLNDPEGRACGLIAALYPQHLDLEIYSIHSMLTMFAPRVSAELNRKRTADTLRESEERYRAFVESSPDACCRIEFDEPIDTGLPEDEQLAKILRYGHVAECNEALVQKLGLEREALIGAGISEVALDMKEVRSVVLSMIRSGYRHITMEVAPVDQKGKRRHFMDSYWGIVESGKLQRIWGSSRDVTDQRSLEVQFRHLQKLDCIGKLASGVAHDFNNLLTVIRAYSSQLAPTLPHNSVHGGRGPMHNEVETSAPTGSVRWVPSSSFRGRYASRHPAAALLTMTPVLPWSHSRRGFVSDASR